MNIVMELLWMGLGIYFGFNGQVTNCIGAFIMARTFRLEGLNEKTKES